MPQKILRKAQLVVRLAGYRDLQLVARRSGPALPRGARTCQVNCVDAWTKSRIITACTAAVVISSSTTIMSSTHRRIRESFASNQARPRAPRRGLLKCLKIVAGSTGRSRFRLIRELDDVMVPETFLPGDGKVEILPKVSLHCPEWLTARPKR
jgi:hypothetical protein